MSTRVANSAGVALARALHSQVVHFAIGEGIADWDSLAAPPDPDPQRTTLYNEVARVVALVQYVDATFAPQATPTNRIQATATFPVGVATGALRECALFAYGTGAINSGILIQLAVFRVILKPTGSDDFALQRTLRLRVL